MKNASFGKYALALISFNLGFSLLHLFEIFPFFYTLFYPLFMFLAFLLSVMGYFERDKNTTPSLLSGLLSFALLVHWIAMLVLRLQAA